jgi:hypothetical protein
VLHSLMKVDGWGSASRFGATLRTPSANVNAGFWLSLPDYFFGSTLCVEATLLLTDTVPSAFTLNS